MGCGGCERKVYNQHLKLKSFLQHLELNYQASQPQTLENFLEPNPTTSSFKERLSQSKLSTHFLCLLVYSRIKHYSIKLSSKGVECVSVCVSRVKWTKVRSSFRGRPPKINWRPKRSVRLDRVWIVLGFFTARCIDFNNCTSQ